LIPRINPGACTIKKFLVIKIKTIHSYSTIEVKGKVCFGALYMEIWRNF
jgi:hypothetical protein